LIQLLPRNVKIEVDKKDSTKSIEAYETAVWTYAKFIHPPKIEMTPYDCDKWVLDTISKVNSDPSHEFYGWMIDRVVYWKIDDTHCVTIKRDKKWFAEKLLLYLKTWKEVEFFRKNLVAKELLREFLISTGFEFDKEDRTFNTNYFADKLQKKIKELLELGNKVKDSQEYNSITNSFKNEIETNKKHLKDGTIKEKLKADKYPNRSSNYTGKKTYYMRKNSPYSSDENNDDGEFEIIDMDN
jgi:hypothetical protein